MKLVIWCDTDKATAANNQYVGPGLVATVRLDHDRHEYSIGIVRSETRPNETAVYLSLGPRWSDTLRAAGELELPTPLGFTLHLCEAPSC